MGEAGLRGRGRLQRLPADNGLAHVARARAEREDSSALAGEQWLDWPDRGMPEGGPDDREGGDQAVAP